MKKKSGEGMNVEEFAQYHSIYDDIHGDSIGFIGLGVKISLDWMVIL